MHISLEWLNEFLDLKDLSGDQVSDILTSIGHEVESVTSLEALPETILTGKILSAEPHPQADKLQVCQVDVSAESPLTIVCGAPNARPGLCVAVATIGTDLGEGFVIKPAKIRGQASEGMLCSEKELGLGDEHDGILELPTDTKPGVQLETILPKKDTILEVSLTPNRGDCLSYLGMARDLAARLGKTVTRPDTSVSHASYKTRDKVSVKVDADAGCGRFTALHMEGLKAVQSPYWLRRRLTASGMRPINLLVDITNYVLLETGQPVHAYDERFLAGGQIHVRNAHIKDALTTLDGADAGLKSGDLLICDAEKPVGLAGIMGGANSEIKEDSTALVLEVAHFDPIQIRKTAKRLALHTEASHRFERGIDLESIPQVSLRVASLIQSCSKECGIDTVQVADELIDWYPNPVSRPRIALRLKRARALLGLPHLKLETCIKHLESLELTLIDQTSERMLFEIPGFRNDLNREVDLIEEVGRIEGFEKVPYEMPKMNIAPGYEQPVIRFAEQAKAGFAAAGLNECISFPFHSEQDYKNLGVSEQHPLWPSAGLENPLNEEMGWLNTSLIPSLLKAVLRNRHHGQKGSKLFEFGRAFFKKEQLEATAKSASYYQSWAQPGAHLTPKAQSEADRIVEKNLIAGICDHPFHKQTWEQAESAPGFFHGKQLLTKVIRLYSHKDISWSRPENPETFPWLHPGASGVLSVEGVTLGYLGELHPKIALNWGLKGDLPVVFELDLEALFSICRQDILIDSTQRKFPAVHRDLALLIDRNTSWQEIRQSISEFPKKKFLQHSELFDIYIGEGIPDQKKSIAASFVFECQDKTLTDKEVEKETTQLLAWLKKQHDAELR